MTNKIEIPKTIDVTIYTYAIVASEYEHNIGRVVSYTFECSPSIGDRYELLAETVITVTPKQIDLYAAVLSSYKEMREDTIARHFVELKEVQDKIDNLLAIEYKPQEEALENDNN